MTPPLTCAECGVELTVTDADYVVKTDAGPVHSECFQGPFPLGGPGAEEAMEELGRSLEETLAPEEEAAENERRREMGDPPLPEDPRTGVFPCEPFSVAGPRPDAIIWDDYPVIVEGQTIGEVAYRQTEGGLDRLPVTDPLSRPRPDCPECGAEPSINGGRGLLCRGRSML